MALLCALLVSGCGARGGLLDPAPDVPAVPDVPTLPDVPALPDVPSDRVVPSVCGNGRTETGEACDLGATNANVPAFTLRQTGRPAVPVLPAGGRASATSFYAYRSASSHTGLEALGEANLILHVDRTTNTLSLVFFAGIDGDLGGAQQPDAAMRAVVSGIPSGARVLLSDDPGECDLRGDTVTCDWTFQRNTDGFVIGPLPASSA